MEKPSIQTTVFRGYRSTLLDAITEPEILPLANLLYSNYVISRYALEEAEMTTRTPTERKTRLFDAIEATIRAGDSGTFATLLCVLRSDSLSLCHHAEEMWLKFVEHIIEGYQLESEYSRLQDVWLELCGKAEADDSADEAQADVEESNECDDKEKSGGLLSGLRRGIRKLFGAAKDMTASFIKGVIKTLHVDIHVSRKYKKRFDKHTNREQVRWWFEIWGDESALTALEANWEKVSAETKWRLETCPVVSQQC